MTPDDLFRKYHNNSCLDNDPIAIVHRFSDEADIETVGLIASAFAYGRVEQIKKSIEAILHKTGHNLFEFINSTSLKEKKKAFLGFKHRFNDGIDVAMLLQSIKIIRNEYGSLEGLFLKGYNEDHLNIKSALHDFTEAFLATEENISYGSKKSFAFLFPSPMSGSACKRMNMYLRWMVRLNDGVDFGLWKNINPSKLVVPVDTHLAAWGRKMGFTERKSADWKMAEEITKGLKKYDQKDPVKYDFAICSAGKAAFRFKK